MTQILKTNLSDLSRNLQLLSETNYPQNMNDRSCMPMLFLMYLTE